MKLYSLLFEADDQKPRWNPDNLALAHYKAENDFILYDTEKLKDAIKLGTRVNLLTVVAAYVELRKPRNQYSKCSGAWNIAFSARNPAYPGAGQLTVKLASSVMGVPLTSDRSGSSSKDAKAMWQRVAADSSFTKVPLDNWFEDNSQGDDPRYMDIMPSGKAVELPGPQTPTEEDDCIVPGGNIQTAAKALGSKDAYQSSVDATPFQQRHEAMLTLVRSEMGQDEGTFARNLADAGSTLFNAVYESR